MAKWVKYVSIALILLVGTALLYQFGDTLDPNYKFSSYGNIPLVGAIIFGVIGVAIMVIFLNKRRKD